MVRKRIRLGDHIRDLARRTDASPSYADKVRALFTCRGISLDGDASPYFDALEEVFLRQQAIRHNVSQVNENLAELQNRLATLGMACAGQASKLNRLRDSMEGKLRLLRDASRRMKNPTLRALEKERLYPGDRDVWVVPGPESLQ